MQQKLKRIKVRTHAFENFDFVDCSDNQLDIKMKSCIATSNAQASTKRTILPNHLKNFPIMLSKNSSSGSRNHSASNSTATSTTARIDKKNAKNFDNALHRHYCHTNWCYKRNQRSRTTTKTTKIKATTTRHKLSIFGKLIPTICRCPSTLSLWQILVISCLVFLVIQCANIQMVNANKLYDTTTPFQRNTEKLTISTAFSEENVTQTPASKPDDSFWQQYKLNGTTREQTRSNGNNTTADADASGGDSIFMRFAKRFSTGNELWDGIIRDCYQQPSFTCFQTNVYSYLNSALETGDVNVTDRFKFYKNNFNYKESEESDEEQKEENEAVVSSEDQMSSTEAAMEGHDDNDDDRAKDEHLMYNEIPHSMGRAASDPESPIEEVTSSLYGKSVKFAMTHDIEVKLPEMLFDGATFRISPRAFEGNGIIAKLELIPKQEIQARLAGKVIMNKIKKFLRSKLLLSFLALLLIIKIIKIKLFWLLPIVIGVGAAKKLLLKFLLFLFPALSHLFKLCSYYQQTYHSTKYHHHLHHIDHHHTIVPPWHADTHHSAPEIIYTSPPKGHPSAYLHGAPIHETYGPPAFQHDEGNWESSGPGLGSEYISDINRAAEIEGNSNYFKPHTNDANEIQAWGLGATPQRPKPQYTPQTQQQRPPFLQQQQQQQQQQQKNFQKNKQQILAQAQAHKQQQLQYQQKTHHPTSQSFNPFISDADKQSIFSSKYKTPLQAQSAPRPVYTPPRNAGNANFGSNLPPQHAPPHNTGMNGIASLNGLNAAQIAAQYEPTRNPAIQKQENISPEIAAQLKEAIRIQAEQRIIAEQKKILDKEPFVQDGQPLMPKNYDPFYSPILLKIDKIVEQLGITDELCKERLICSMYKDPTRYTPHSNFVSAELSRDTNELQPVTSTNPAVMRFYRLIQAARDGQDRRDCLSLYPQCNINTE